MTSDYSQLYSIQSVDFDQFVQALAATGVDGPAGVITGFAATVTGTDLNVSIAAGRARLQSGVVVNFSGSTSVSFTGVPDGTNPKKSLIVIDSTGAIVKRNGTAEAAQPTGDIRRNAIRPAAPELTAGDIPLAEVYLSAGATTIASADVTDRIVNVRPDIRLRHDFMDDFIGDALDARWATTLTGGTITVIDNIENGILRFSTGATNGNDARLHFGAIRQYKRSLNPRMIFRLKLGQIGTNYSLLAGFVQSDFDPSTAPAGTNNHALLYAYFDSVDIQDYLALSTADGTIQSKFVGVASDTSYHTYTLELRSGDVRLWVDGVLRYTKTTNLPTSTILMQPYVGINTATTVDKTADLDYIKIEQERTYP